MQIFFPLGPSAVGTGYAQSGYCRKLVLGEDTWETLAGMLTANNGIKSFMDFGDVKVLCGAGFKPFSFLSPYGILP